MTYDVPSRSLKNLLEEHTTEYQSQLSGSPGESHLLERGVTPEAIQHFRLGYVGEPAQGDDYYRGRISIPYTTVTGVVSIRFRSLEVDPEKKYLTVQGESARPYNVDCLKKAKLLILTEGEIDTIICWQMGLASLGIPGADAWNPLWARFLRFRKVVMFADGDDAGKRCAATVKKDVPSLIVFSMPWKKDVNDMYLDKGETYFRSLLNG